MNIYVAHAKALDYKNELYTPLRESELNNIHNIMLPHEQSDKPFSTKEFFQTKCDLMLAEVTHRATGLGIEIGYADVYNVPMIGMYKKGSKLSASVKGTIKDFIEYESSEDLINQLIKKLRTK